ncbi:TRAP transporter small permease subunit [Sporosarcina aquimarina]|uniref:TRAP transporter small permease subunit n=1 Tax=Sporosarcina aquimarina TaxID=114975 RepID=UPI001C8DA33E|nr:TRAP transporter small permease subunit [Sporosarcina aquimarina]MBY0221395.1 TRAP transporter small permease [Sporosarcina aquimarina]
MISIITRLERIIESINKLAFYIACFLVFCLMFLTFSDVTGRYLIRPVTGTYELTGIFLSLIVFLSLGYTQIKKGHISIGILVEKFPPRIQAIIDVVTYIVVLFTLILMTQQTFIYAQRSINNVTGELGIPVYLFIIIGGIGILLFALAILIDLIKAIQKVVSNNYDI